MAPFIDNNMNNELIYILEDSSEEIIHLNEDNSVPIIIENFNEENNENIKYSSEDYSNVKEEYEINDDSDDNENDNENNDYNNMGGLNIIYENYIP